jgi:hypothetical protein
VQLLLSWLCLIYPSIWVPKLTTRTYYYTSYLLRHGLTTYKIVIYLYLLFYFASFQYHIRDHIMTVNINKLNINWKCYNMYLYELLKIYLEMVYVNYSYFIILLISLNYIDFVVVAVLVFFSCLLSFVELRIAVHGGNVSKTCL